MIGLFSEPLQKPLPAVVGATGVMLDFVGRALGALSTRCDRRLSFRITERPGTLIEAVIKYSIQEERQRPPHLNPTP